MMKQILKSAALIGLCFGVLALVGVALTPAAQAEDYDKGLQAYQQGDYATALKYWEPLAEAGDVTMQYRLGLMYGLGEGVEQSYETALEWFKKAEAQGHTVADNFVLGIEECRMYKGCWQ